MNTVELLSSGLTELAIPFSQNQITAFMAYLSELKKWNKAYNLTALKSDRDIVIKHFLDSLLYLRLIPAGTLHLADAGAGAGLPGIAIRIMRPEIETALIEPSRKKAAFLRNIVRHLHLEGTQVIENRIENLGKEFEGKYNVIVSRAAFSLKDFLATACFYVKKGGVLIVSKGPGASEELQELKSSGSAGKAVREIQKLQLPFSGDRRILIALSCRMK